MKFFGLSLFCSFLVASGFAMGHDLIQVDFKAELNPMQYVSYGSVSSENSMTYGVGLSSQIYFTEQFGFFLGADQTSRAIRYQFASSSIRALAPFLDLTFGPVFRANIQELGGSSLLVAKAGLFYSLPMRSDFYWDGTQVFGTTQRSWGVIAETALYFPLSRCFHLGPVVSAKTGLMSPMREAAADFNFYTDLGVGFSGLVKF